MEDNMLTHYDNSFYPILEQLWWKMRSIIFEAKTPATGNRRESNKRISHKRNDSDDAYLVKPPSPFQLRSNPPAHHRP
jgi:hypothetical protein